MEQSFVLITNNPGLAACISSAFAKQGQYFPVFDAPRVERPDADNEIIRLVNAIVRLKPSTIIYGDLPKSVSSNISKHIPVESIHISSKDDLSKLEGLRITNIPAAEKAALALFRVCSSKSDKKLAVIVEDPKEISSVIAANYAIAHNAELLVLGRNESLKKEVTDKLNNISNTKHRDIRKIEIEGLREYISSKLPVFLNWQKYEKLLFITEGIPYSLALPNEKVVHASSLNLGHFLAHNRYEFEYSRFKKEGLIGLFVRNSGMNTTNEQAWFSDALMRAKGFSKTISNIHTALTELEIEILPYDVLYIATHGKQVEGTRNTYTFIAKDKQEHTVSILESEGVGGKLIFIESVDGVIKDSDEWSSKHGEIWGEIAKRIGKRNDLKPVIGVKVTIPMRELILGGNNEPGLNSPINFDRLAYQRMPLVIVNACGSWGDIFYRFMYAGASSYIGTLWPVYDSEAEQFADAFLKKVFSLNLDDAFFEAKDSLREDLKQNYVFTGTFESKFDPGAEYSPDAYTSMVQRLGANAQKAKDTLRSRRKLLSPKHIDWYERDIWYFEKELAEVEKLVEDIKNGKH
jgi:hypothetical protein